MDKTAIKNFSIWARNKLIADITYKAGLLGVTEEGIKDALPQSTQDAEFYDIGTKEPYAIHGEEIKQRKELVAAIKRKATQLAYKDAYRNVVEEVAYTWFNRLIAIRFMEVNDFMPAHIRVLSSDSKNKLEPDLVTTPFDAELEFSQAEKEKIIQMKNDNQVDALFRFLFIKQCNALNAYLPKLFEKTSDYTELLLNVSVTDQDGIVYHLTHDIVETDFNIAEGGQIEIIGWLYQYYNIEPKNAAFAKKGRITKDEIPAVTQLFTPEWIVRYMVENSVGRVWIDAHEDIKLRNEWKYYLDEAEQNENIAEQLRKIRENSRDIKPEDIKVIDPCMGSGHILVYAFDVLMQIYESYGYSQRDAAVSIVENNIYGLDIDDRAFQLAYFAIMMKARSYNRRFLTLEIEPNLCAIQESNGLQYDKDMGDFLLNEEHRETLQYLLHTFVDAKEYGSILNVDKRDYDGFLEAWKLTAEASLGNVVMMLWYNECNEIVPMLAKQAKIISHKYNVAITNPPYMVISNGSNKLVEYTKTEYPDSKTDLYAVFIEKCKKLLRPYGYQAMITQHTWMFLSSYEKLREKLKDSIMINMAHLGSRAFDEIGGEVVQTTSFVLFNHSECKYKGTYLHLVDACGEKAKEELFLSKEKLYYAKQENFELIPGMPYAYWASDKLFEVFNRATRLEQLAHPRKGLATTDNNRFLRLWQEVDKDKLGIGFSERESAKVSGKKWFPLNKGGEYRKWYGNKNYVVNWENDGIEMKDAIVKRYNGGSYTKEIRSEDKYFRNAITWSALTAGDASFRWSDYGALFDSAGSSMFPDDNEYYILGLVNSKVVNYILYMINPTLNYGAGSIGSIPVIIDETYIDTVIELVKENVNIAREDWNDFENSWDFLSHPLVRLSKDFGRRESTLEELFEVWRDTSKKRRERIRDNEENLNRIFLEIYGLDSELDYRVNEKEINISFIDREMAVSSLISYAVGCMFGRYSLSCDGVVSAGRKLCMNDYSIFVPDEDNILLITDEEYVTDDIVKKFIKFLEVVFGKTKLNDNLQFVVNSIGQKGNSFEEMLRNYFLNSFFKNHCSDYSASGSGKRPIYWLFDSGKQNGFKALIYMHRYNADTIGNLRVDYLHRMERIYESEINRMQDTIDNSSNAREVTTATKRKEKLQKQLKECQEYDEKIGHLALSRIEIDLDDGVKVNYEKVQTANDGKKYQVLAKI